MLLFAAAMLAAGHPAASEPPSGAGKRAPRTLSGFTLGADIKTVRARLRMETLMPVRYAETMKEVEAVTLPGVKTALVTFSTCRYPDRILRIKVKYADTGLEFHEKLLAALTRRFGKPGQWLGDPFGIVKSWKWNFTDEKGHRISLIVSHNAESEDERVGNTAKLTDVTAMMEEEACHDARDRARKLPPPPPSPPVESLLPY